MCFYVVHFIKDDAIDFISEKWLFGRNECFWPMSDIPKLRSKHTEPEPSWEKYAIRILSSAGE